MSELMLSNISDISSCGEDCKYEDSFLEIEQEVDNDKSVTQENETNWNFVVSKSEEFLSKESKDLKIVSWWLYGNYKTNSWNGLKQSLDTYIKILEKFNIHMYPSSIRAKKNIFIWLEDTITSLMLPAIDNIQYGFEFYELFLKLNTIISNDFDIEEKFFSKLIRELENYKKVEVKVEEKQETKASSTSANVTSAINIDEITDDSSANNVLREFKKYGNMLCTYYRNNDFADFKSLRINRLLSWLDTDGLPFNEENTTYLQPPSVLELDKLKDYINNEEYKVAFLLIEEIIAVSPFWIDGHYEAFKILEKTNNFELANELKNSLLSFIKTNEGILNLKFTDETAFANKRTRDWIEEELGNAVVSNNTSSNDSNDDVLKQVYELAEKNKINEAFELLDSTRNTSINEEIKFTWRLNKVKVAIEFDKKDIAFSLLEELEMDIEKYNLRQWNPKLSAEVYELMLSSFSSLDMDSEKRTMLYKNLCITDVCKALTIKI